MAITKENNNVKINKIAIILLISLATVIGLAPLALTIHRPQLLIYFSVGNFILAFLFVKSKKTDATETPGFWEFVLSGLGAIFSPAFIGLLGLILYGLIYLITKFVELIVNAFNPNAAINADLVAYYPTLIFMIIFNLLLSFGTVPTMIDQLYSKTAGMKSVFYDMVYKQGRRLAIGIVLVVLILIVWIGIVARFTHTYSSWWSNLVILFYLASATAFLSTASQKESKSFEDNKIVSDLQKLYEACGFEMTPAPRTGRRDMDPLLVNLDLYARKGSQAYAIEIKNAGAIPDAATFSNVANMTMTAAWALQDFFGKEAAEQLKVEPLLVLLGTGQDATLRAWKQVNDIKTIVIPDTQEILNILNIEDPIKLKQMALGYLGLSEFSKEGGAS